MTTSRLVVLDGYTLNPGDLSWERLLSLGNCSIYDRTPQDQIVAEAADAEMILTNKAVLSRDAIAALPALKYIGVTATGVNVVDLEAAREHGVVVTNVPFYGTASVAQMVMAHVLHFAHCVSEHSQAVQAGRWSRAEDFCFWDSPQVELAGQTMGIIGFGRIGAATATLADALGMQVVAHNHSPIKNAPKYVEQVDLDKLLCESDVVSLHCPLTPETEGLINAERLRMMKSTALLINTSRGGLIDESALAEALKHAQLAGAGLDVLSEEPPPPDHPLLGIPNCIITPHIAWATRSARARCLDTAIKNVAAFLAGEPQNVVA